MRTCWKGAFFNRLQIRRHKNWSEESKNKNNKKQILEATRYAQAHFFLLGFHGQKGRSWRAFFTWFEYVNDFDPKVARNALILATALQLIVKNIEISNLRCVVSNVYSPPSSDPPRISCWTKSSIIEYRNRTYQVPITPFVYRYRSR